MESATESRRKEPRNTIPRADSGDGFMERNTKSKTEEKFRPPGTESQESNSDRAPGVTNS